MASEEQRQKPNKRNNNSLKLIYIYKIEVYYISYLSMINK